MRRKLDAYNTPSFFAKALLRRWHIDGVIYEPCVGTGNLSSVFREAGLRVLTNDINKKIKAHRHYDASTVDAWKIIPDWTITNPPFSHALPILQLAYEKSRVGVAFLLRLSFLEPCKDRACWLVEHPPTAVFALPRISWTEDGRKDQVTAMWAVWDKTSKEQMIRIISKDELSLLNQ